MSGVGRDLDVAHRGERRAQVAVEAGEPLGEGQLEVELVVSGQVQPGHPGIVPETGTELSDRHGRRSRARSGSRS